MGTIAPFPQDRWILFFWPITANGIGRSMPYRAEFTPAVREQALRRAIHRCERCGVRWPLEFHHRGYRGDRSLFNCEVLCAGCHYAEHVRRNGRRRPAT
jgi:hypothetical protein